MPKTVVAFRSPDEAISILKNKKEDAQRHGLALRYLVRCLKSSLDAAFHERVIGELKAYVLDGWSIAENEVLPELTENAMWGAAIEMSVELAERGHASKIIRAQIAQILSKSLHSLTFPQNEKDAIAARIGKTPESKAADLYNKIMKNQFDQEGRPIGNEGGVQLLLKEWPGDLLERAINRDVEVANILKSIFALHMYDDIYVGLTGKAPYGDTIWAPRHLIENRPDATDPVLVMNFNEKIGYRPEDRRQLIYLLFRNIKSGVYDFKNADQAEDFQRDLLRMIESFGRSNPLAPGKADPMFEELATLPSSLLGEEYSSSGGLGYLMIQALLRGHEAGDYGDENLPQDWRDSYFSRHDDRAAFDYFMSNPGTFVSKIKAMIADSSKPDLQEMAISEGLPRIFSAYSRGELMKLWDSVSPNARASILSAIGDNFDDNVLRSLAESGNPTISNLAKTIMQRRRGPDVEALSQKKTVVATVQIQDMADALRKMRSPNPNEALAAILFLLVSRSAESTAALERYVWSERYQPIPGRVLLSRMYHSDRDESVLIAFAVINRKHPDKVLRLIAGEVLAASLSIQSIERQYPEIMDDEDVLAGFTLVQYFRANRIGGYNTASINEEIDRLGAVASENPGIGKSMKRMLCLHSEFDPLLDHTKTESSQPSLALSRLLLRVPEMSDALDINDFLTKSERPNVFEILECYAIGLRNLPPLDDKKKKEFMAINREMLQKAGTKIDFRSGGDPESLVSMLPRDLATILIDSYSVNGQGKNTEFYNIVDRMREKVLLSGADTKEKAAAYKKNPRKYVNEMKELVFEKSPDQALAVRELLPSVYHEIDQGTMSRLWEESDRQVKISIIEAVGDRWPSNTLAAIANGQDKDLAAWAARHLANRQESHLLPRHLRDPEL